VVVVIVAVVLVVVVVVVCSGVVVVAGHVVDLGALVTTSLTHVHLDVIETLDRRADDADTQSTHVTNIAHLTRQETQIPKVCHFFNPTLYTRQLRCYNRPHYGICPSVRPSVLCLSVLYEILIQKQKRVQTKIV